MTMSFLSPVTRHPSPCVTDFHLQNPLSLSEAAVDYEQLPMLSMLSSQGKDCQPISHSLPGNRGSMKPTQELGESGRDNG